MSESDAAHDAHLCLGSPIFRLNDPTNGGQVLNTGATGTVSFTPNLNVLPPGVALQPGETWYFQFWFRDFDWVNNNFTSNTTDGIEVMFR